MALYTRLTITLPAICLTSMAKAKKANMTIDRLAQMTQREFVTVREDMKDGFAEMNDKVDALRRNVGAGFQEVSSGMKVIIYV